MFCRTEENLTDEHVFPAFMGGELEVKKGSCEDCNRHLGAAEAFVKEATTPLLNLLQIQNRYKVVPNAALKANIRGLDLKNLPAFMDGDGNLNLKSTVRESTDEQGRRVRQGFFLTPEEGEKFAARARKKGLQVVDRGVPAQIVVDSGYTIRPHFIASIEARKMATKIALAAIAFEYGLDFALRPQFDELRAARTASRVEDLPVRFFANDGLMNAYVHAAWQHGAFCYLSAGMRKGWVVVTLFGGITYIVLASTSYAERESRQFSIFYNAITKKRFSPVVLADEMTLIGHVLSPATSFEDPAKVHDQWYPILTEYCAEKGVIVEPFAD
jgi:hypothetical protein